MLRISKTITNRLIENGLIEEKDRAVYEYAASVFGCLILPFAFVLLLIPLTGLKYEGFILIIPFTLLRRYCGGFHFQKYQVCFVVSLIYLYSMERIGILINANAELVFATLLCLCALAFIGIRKSFQNSPYSCVKRNVEILIICVMLALSILWLFEVEKYYVAKWLCMGVIMTILLQIPPYFFHLIYRVKKQIVD